MADTPDTPDLDALLAALTDKERAFVLAYVECLNATKAAKLARYSETSARQIGSENLSKPHIRAALDALLDARAMPAGEILARLSDHARGSMEDFFSVRGRGITLDLKKAAERGVLHLIKRYSKTKQGVTIELHDPQAALQLLGRHYRLFIDRTELTGKDGDPIEVSDARATLADKLARRAGRPDAEPDPGRG
jgi:phage terminase small subunit